MRFRRRSQSAQCDGKVYLLDSMGELPRHYAAADVAFVGSLLPFGGHNVLEPAVLGRPVLVGPHTFNFTEGLLALLEDAGALVVVADARALAQAALHWLRDSNERDRVGGVARDIVHRHRGATHRTVGVVRELLGVAPLLIKPCMTAAAKRLVMRCGHEIPTRTHKLFAAAPSPSLIIA